MMVDSNHLNHTAAPFLIKLIYKIASCFFLTSSRLTVHIVISAIACAHIILKMERLEFMQ
uniref:Uncharacterized protein n=1 Tax=Arion vulgaris TaxID=1028688 RepID=A0A0B6ZHZ9_9EUPU